LEEIKALDAAYWFVPGRHTTRNAEEHESVFRGVATGDRELPEEYEHYEPNDFTIPTLREVLETFPDVWLNIEIKTGPPTDDSYAQQVADLLDEFDRVDDVIVVSFVDTVVEEFKLLAPDVSTATATGMTAAFWATAQGPLPGAPNPRYHALQVPIEFLGVTVVTEDFVARAQANDLAVHVWTINDAEVMQWLLDIGVDGIMTDRPSLLAAILAERTSAGVR
jgi:glycerophosphoryl diester phosphodiesterase